MAANEFNLEDTPTPYDEEIAKAKHGSTGHYILCYKRAGWLKCYGTTQEYFDLKEEVNRLQTKLDKVHNLLVLADMGVTNDG